MNEAIFSIAIDGAAGVGKSTVAKTIADRLNILYLDTGAMYRAVGLHMLRQGIDLSSERAIEGALVEAQISVKYVGGRQRTYLGEEDVSEAIRTQEVGKAGSDVSTVKAVREALVEMQRDIARGQSVVMDGRDIGTHVLKDATLKVFLTADAAVRAKRRVQEFREKGISADESQVLKEINERDRQDMTRVQSPLRQAEDAVEIKTDQLTREQVASGILGLLSERLGGAAQ